MSDSEDRMTRHEEKIYRAAYVIGVRGKLTDPQSLHDALNRGFRDGVDELHAERARRAAAVPITSPSGVTVLAWWGFEDCSVTFQPHDEPGLAPFYMSPQLFNALFGSLPPKPETTA